MRLKHTLAGGVRQLARLSKRTAFLTLGMMMASSQAMALSSVAASSAAPAYAPAPVLGSVYSIYSKFILSGGAACSLMHALVTPLDVVKTRLQTRPGEYAGLASAAKRIWNEEGPGMLLQGLKPTFLGYLLYGGVVYPGYEFFKLLFEDYLGPSLAGVLHAPLVLLAGATATVFACISTCPMEAVRIRMVAQPSFANSTRTAFARYINEEGVNGLFAGLKPMMLRQVLFGTAKFFVYDYVCTALLMAIPYAERTVFLSALVSLVAGMVAGIVSSMISQPADTILSRVNQAAGGKQSVVGTAQNIISERGLKGLFTGMGSRCVWSGAIIAGQFALFNLFCSALKVSPQDLRVLCGKLALPS